MTGLSTPTALSWNDLSAVVCPTAKQDDVDAVIKKLQEASADGGLDLLRPDDTDGLTAGDIDEMGNAVGVWVQRALLKKLVKAAVARITKPEDGGIWQDGVKLDFESPVKDRPAGGRNHYVPPGASAKENSRY